MLEFIILLFLSAVCRAVSEISKFRRERSWLPPFFTARNGWLNIDGYHIFSTGVWIFAFLAGGFAIANQLPLWWWPIIWFAYGNLFNLFYHVIFMKPGWRDNFVWDWFKELFAFERVRRYE